LTSVSTRVPSERLARPDASAAIAPGASGPFEWQAYLVTFALGAAFFALNEDFTLTGDSAIYADYALNARFDEVVVHYGYYRLLWVLHHTIGAWTGVPLEELLVHLNVAFGASSLAVGLALGRELLGERRSALLAVVIFAVTLRVVTNASSGEVYIAQTFTLLVSFLLFVRGHVVAAGVAAGLALYITTLSVFACLFYPVVDWQRHGRIRLDVWAKLLSAAALVYGPLLMVHGHALLWGKRGLLAISGGTATSYRSLIVNTPAYQFKQYTTMLLLAIPLLRAWRAERGVLALTAAVIVPHLYVIAKLTLEDDVFILPTDFFFACCLAAGARHVGGRWGRAFVGASVVVHVTIMIGLRMFFPADDNRGDGLEQRMIARTYLASPDSRVVTDWTRAVTLTYFGRPTIRGLIEDDPIFPRAVWLSGDELVSSVPPGAQVYALEFWSPSPIGRVFRSEEYMERRRADNSSRALAKRRLGLDCPDLVWHGRYTVYRCHDPRE
jgi:hypothetical protein